MLPWIQLDTAKIPGGGELRLKSRGSEFSIMLGTNELMNSRLSGSEEALATLAFERIATHKRPHILIGGLGMGFTLRAALAVFPEDAKVTVAELVPAVVDWARGPMPDASTTRASQFTSAMSARSSPSRRVSSTRSCSMSTTAPTASLGKRMTASIPMTGYANPRPR
jgi:hypothetical protein